MKGPVICCFTGHRAIEAHHYKKLPELLDQSLEDMIMAGVTVFRAGGAIGFDTLAALKVLEKKKRYGHIRLELILPCRNQAERWSEQNRTVYQYILDRADSVTCLRERYIPGCMQERNRRLVDGSRFCLAFCTKSEGGSAYTVAYAQKHGVSVINLFDSLPEDTGDAGMR